MRMLWRRGLTLLNPRSARGILQFNIAAQFFGFGASDPQTLHSCAQFCFGLLELIVHLSLTLFHIGNGLITHIFCLVQRLS